jgi:hypothetical protein
MRPQAAAVAVAGCAGGTALLLWLLWKRVRAAEAEVAKYESQRLEERQARSSRVLHACLQCASSLPWRRWNHLRERDCILWHGVALQGRIRAEKMLHEIVKAPHRELDGCACRELLSLRRCLRSPSYDR